MIYISHLSNLQLLSSPTDRQTDRHCVWNFSSSSHHPAQNDQLYLNTTLGIFVSTAMAFLKNTHSQFEFNVFSRLISKPTFVTRIAQKWCGMFPGILESRACPFPGDPDFDYWLQGVRSMLYSHGFCLFSFKKKKHVIYNN